MCVFWKILIHIIIFIHFTYDVFAYVSRIVSNKWYFYRNIVQHFRLHTNTAAWLTEKGYGTTNILKCLLILIYDNNDYWLLKMIWIAVVGYHVWTHTRCNNTILIGLYYRMQFDFYRSPCVLNILRTIDC